MANEKPIIEVPYQAEMLDENGKVTRPWIDFFSAVSDSLNDLETAATNMEDLSTGTDGAPTATDIANSWEALRDDLLNI